MLVDGATENAPFGTTAISDTWGIGEENKMLLYLSYAAYDASTITIPQGTKLIHPADPTLAYEFTEDVVITKGSAEWPIRVLLGSEVELGETLKADVTMRIPSVHYEEGMKLIHPGKGHMCTTLTLLVVCDESTPGAEKLLKKCRLHKSFRFSIDGWMDFHTGLMTLGSGKAAANFGGHDNLKLLRQLIR